MVLVKTEFTVGTFVNSAISKCFPFTGITDDLDQIAKIAWFGEIIKSPEFDAFPCGGL